MNQQKHWRTTAFGIVGIAGVVCSAVWQIHTGQHVDFGSVAGQVGVIAAAAGLIPAADASIVDKIKAILPK
jgi:hypothetical protein